MWATNAEQVNVCKKCRKKIFKKLGLHLEEEE